MKTRLPYFAAICFLAVFTFGFIKDEDPLKNLLGKLTLFTDRYPQEKIHLHFDKPYYSIGDTIWFKAYLANAEKNQLSALSKILYVELINERDSIKKSLLLPVASGLSWGDIPLTDSLDEGNYRIRAYTNWMRNFGEEFFFDKTIKIGNSFSNNILTNVTYHFSKVGNTEKVRAEINYTDLTGNPLAGKEVNYEVLLQFRNIAKGKGVTNKQGKIVINFTNTQPFLLKSGKLNTSLKLSDKQSVSKSFAIKSTSDNVDIQFFPEGGQLVNNILSKVGFKAVGADGLGVDISGEIIDANNTKITDFNSEHAGMGSFRLTPADGATYSASIKLPDGSEKKIALPKAAKEGYVLSVSTQDPDNLYIKVTTSPSLLNKGEIAVVGQSNGIVQYASRSKLEKTVVAATLPKKRFNTGILQLTLFSPSFQPVAERLVFIQNNDELKLKAVSDKESYTQKEKVKMVVQAEGPDGKPVRGTFSIAVTDNTKVPVDEDSENTIFSDLLLTSDLKGYIEKPNYYFTATTAEKEKHLDNLMLTQGWRRFSWKNIMQESFPPLSYFPQQSLEISGRVTTARDKPVVGGKVKVLSTSGDRIALDTITDAEGRFSFPNLMFTDNTKFVIEARSAQNKKNVYIDINQIPAPLVTRNKNTPDIEINVNQSILPYLKNNKAYYDNLRQKVLSGKSIVLQEVKVIDKKPKVPHSSNLNGAGNADQIVTADNLKNCISLVNCLEGRLLGVYFRNGIPYSTRGFRPMRVMLDGVFTSPDYLSILHPNDVESIEVLRNANFLATYGLQGGNGIIIVNTKHGERNMNPNSYARGVASISPQGYFISKEFYSPVYSDPKADNKKPDLRSTIFWTPNIITDESGKATVEFYTSSASGRFRTVIEGLNVDGKLGRQVHYFEVK